MNINIIIGGIISFLLVFWFQVSDRYNNKKKNLFDKIKLPLLVTSLVLLAYLCDVGKTTISTVQDGGRIVQEIFTEQPNF
jgi:hypothetical protein